MNLKVSSQCGDFIRMNVGFLNSGPHSCLDTTHPEQFQPTDGSRAVNSADLAFRDAQNPRSGNAAGRCSQLVGDQRLRASTVCKVYAWRDTVERLGAL